MIYDVSFTVISFRRLPDDSQVKVPKVELIKDIAADTDSAAIAIAARKLPEDSMPDDILGIATIAVRKF